MAIVSILVPLAGCPAVPPREATFGLGEALLPDSKRALEKRYGDPGEALLEARR
jgi:hypothetical protein